MSESVKNASARVRLRAEARAWREIATRVRGEIGVGNALHRAWCPYCFRGTKVRQWISPDASLPMRDRVDDEAWTADAGDLGAHRMYAELLALECEDLAHSLLRESEG